MVSRAPLSGSVSARSATSSSSGPVVNVYWAGSEIVVLRRDADRRSTRESFPAEHVCFLERKQVGPDVLAELRNSRHVAGIRADGEFWRVSFFQRRDALRVAESDGFFAKNNIRVLEADVDPVRRWLTDYEAEIAAPRRVFLDIETDSRVPFNRGHEARILSWALVDDEGNVVARVLLRDNDLSERALLRELFKRLADYDQVLAWKRRPLRLHSDRRARRRARHRRRAPPMALARSHAAV
jgi:hypothetical protein